MHVGVKHIHPAYTLAMPVNPMLVIQEDCLCSKQGSLQNFTQLYPTAHCHVGIALFWSTQCRSYQVGWERQICGSAHVCVFVSMCVCVGGGGGACGRVFMIEWDVNS